MGDTPSYHPDPDHAATHTRHDWEWYSLKQTFQSILGRLGIQGNTKSRSLVVSFPLLWVCLGWGGVGLIFCSYLKSVHLFLFVFLFPQRTFLFFSHSDSEEIDRKRARVRNSEGGDVPQKYFVVTNNQLLRVKYLLVYSQKQHRR